jgi:AsmA protein
MKKVLTIIVIVIAVIVVALTAFIKIYVTPERVKEFVIPTAEKALNRKVNIGEINVSLLKGIGLKDFAIREADQENDFVRCKEFVLKFKLLPLLTKNVVIDELRLVAPEIRIERSKDGKFNFEGIGEKKEPEEVKEEKPTDETKGLPISLLINTIAINDAKFSLTDLMKDLPDIKSSSDINISIESVDGSELFTKGEIDLKVDEVVISKPSEKQISNIAASLQYAININLESKDVRIDKADLIFQEIPVSIEGDIKNLNVSPEIDIAVTLPTTKTSDIQKAVSPFASFKDIGLSGSIAAEIKLKGLPENPDLLTADGGIMLEKVGISYNEINALIDGNIKFNEKTMNIDLKSTVDRNTAELKGSISNYFENQKINLNIYSKKLFLEELIPSGDAGEKPPAEGSQPAPERSSKEADPVDLKLSAGGEIKVDSAIYKEIAMNNFYMKYRFKNNQLEISEMTANVGKGKFKLNSFVDLSKTGYTYKVSNNIDSIQAVNIVNSFVPKAKDTVFGLLFINLRLNGAGTLPESIKKNLSSDVDFSIRDGKITSAKITENLSRFLDIEELKTIDLRQAKGTVKVKNSVARLDSIFTSDYLSMDPSGDIGLDETLDLAFDLKLSPRLTDKAMSSKVSKYIKSEEGWGMIPLKVSGTFADPAYTVDVVKAGERALEKEVDKYIDKLFDKEDEEKKKELEPVKDLLKGIFQ